MTKRFLPLGIALGIHICVFLISGFFIKEKNTEFVSSKNLIDVQFGSGSNAHQKKSNSSKQPVRFLQKISESPEMNANIPNKNLEHNEGLGLSPGNTFESTIINFERPTYPRIAQLRAMKGSIRIRIHVSSEGIPLEYNLIKSSGHDILDKAALEVIPRWKFRSSSKSYSVEKNIIFELKDN